MNCVWDFGKHCRHEAEAEALSFHCLVMQRYATSKESAAFAVA